MAVTKQKRTFMNQPIGVTRFETGEAQMWEAVANTANKLNEIAFKEGAKKAEQFGVDAAMAIDQAQITAFDAETGKPKALNIKNLSGGIIARDAYKRVIEARFRDSIESELLNKAKELQIKYEFQPELYQEEMSRYVADMHANAQGKWKETIKVGGVHLVRSGNLIISEKLKDKTDRENVIHFTKKLDKFLNLSIRNYFSAYGEEGALKSFTELEQLLTELNDLQKVNNKVDPNDILNFERDAIVEIARVNSRTILFSPTSKIQLNNAGNEGRNRIIAALENPESVSNLRGTEKIAFKELTKYTENVMGANENLAELLKPIVEDFNAEFVIQAQESGVRSLVNIQDIYDNQTKTFSKGYHDANYINNFIPDGRFQQIIDKNYNTAKNYITTFAEGDEQQIAAVKAKQNDAEQKLAKIIIEKLIVGKESGAITKIQQILKSNDLKLKNATNEELILINFWRKNNLGKKDFNDIFVTAKQNYQSSNGAKRIEQEKNAIKIGEDYQLYINSGKYSFDEIRNEKNRILNLTNEKNALDNLSNSVFQSFRNNINSLFLEESINQINFGSSALANSTQLFLSSKEGDPNSKLLDDFPEIKNALNNLLSEGFSKSELKTVISKEESNLRTSEVTNSQGNKHIKLMAEMVDQKIGSMATKEHQRALDHSLAQKYGKENNFIDNLTGERGAEFVSDINYMVTELNVLPLSYEAVLVNASEDSGLYDGPQTNAVLELFRIHSHGQNLEKGFERDFLVSRLDTETYAILDFASDLVVTGDSSKALDYIATARAFRDDPTYTATVKKIFGTKEDADGKVINQSYIKFLNEINPEIAENRDAFDIFYEYTLHAARNNIPSTKIQEKIGDLYNRMYGETDGLVTDFLTNDNARSRFALKKVLPNKDLYNAMVSKVQSELAPMGIGFSHGYSQDSTFTKMQYDMTPNNTNFDPYNPEGGPIDYAVQDESLSQPAETMPTGHRFPKFNRQAVLVPVSGSSMEAIYIAYEKTPSGLKMITKTDEDENEIPLAFSTSEQYLLDIQAKAEAKRKEINRNDLRRSEIQRQKLSDENSFRTKDEIKTRSLLQGNFSKVDGYQKGTEPNFPENIQDLGKSVYEGGKSIPINMGKSIYKSIEERFF